MVWTYPPDTCEAPTGTIFDAAYVVWQRLISQTQISRSARRSKSILRILKPAPSNCFAGSFPLLIQFRIVLAETFRYPAAPCTVRGSSPRPKGMPARAGPHYLPRQAGRAAAALPRSQEDQLGTHSGWSSMPSQRHKLDILWW
jgi:hypothetical protein